MRTRYVTDSLIAHGLSLKVFRSPIFTYENAREEINRAQYFSSEPLADGWMKKIPVLREGLIVRHLRRNLRQNWSVDIRLLHAHSSVLNALAGMKIAREKRVPFVYEIRALWEDAAVDQGKTKEGSLRYNVTRNIETHVLKRADHITVICEGLKDDIIKRGIPPGKISVMPNGVDTRQFTPIAKDEALIEKLKLSGFTVIGFIGTFFEFEGIDLLIRAAKKILSTRHDVKFLIVGGGRAEEYVKTLTRDLQLEESIIFTGRVQHEEVKTYYSVMDVLVYPRKSKRITELVTPLKPLEAMALEKLVIGSDVGGIKELVKDGKTGFTFEKGDVDDLSRKCLFALGQRDLAQQISKQAREYVLKERNWMKICESYVNLYKRLGAIE